MSWLNYHHLGYFRAVARAGGLAAAAERLRVAPSTLSAQIKQLEASLGQPLVRRTGRGLSTTPFGDRVLLYADRIFELGETLMREVDAEPDPPLRVGAADPLAKGTVRRALGPALAEGVGLEITEGSPEALLAALQGGALDVALLDAPLAAADRVPGARQVRLLDEPTMVWGRPDRVAEARRDWPASLASSPWVLPTTAARVRRDLDYWALGEGVVLAPVVTCADRAMTLAFAGAGVGLCVAPLDASVPAGLQVLTDLPAVRETTYALVLPRTPPHPGVAALLGR